MTRDEIVTALRCCAEKAGCNECPIGLDDPDCIEKMAGLAADLIENQQRHIEALMKANDSLKDAIAQCTETPGGSFCKDGYCSQKKVWERLKAYEDTGLMPGDVEELIKMAASKTDKVLQLKEELQGAKNTAEQYAAINDTLYDSNMKLAADRKALINELCQYCGKYKHAHEGACDGCRWREM